MIGSKNRVEDPVRIRNFVNSLSALSWVEAEQKNSIQTIFQSVAALAYAEINYYYTRRSGSRLLSKFCRFLGWSLGTAGIMIPLFNSMLGTQAPGSLLSWGYIVLGLAGAILVADNVFAGSQAHQRYVSAQLELEKLFTIFCLEWQCLLLKYETDPNQEHALALLDKSVEFAKLFHASLGSETTEWRKNVNDALSDLREKVSVSGVAKA